MRALVIFGLMLGNMVFGQSVLLPATFKPVPSRVFALSEAMNSSDAFIRNAADLGQAAFAGYDSCTDEGEYIFWDGPSKNASQFVAAITSSLAKMGFKLESLAKRDDPNYRASRVFRITNAQRRIIGLAASYQKDMPISFAGRTAGWSALLWCYVK